MIIKNYVGAEGECIVIQKPTDLYPILHWTQSRMIDLTEDENNVSSIEELESCILFIGSLLAKTEIAGFGNYGDVENIEY